MYIKRVFDIILIVFVLGITFYLFTLHAWVLGGFIGLCLASIVPVVFAGPNIKWIYKQFIETDKTRALKQGEKALLSKQGIQKGDPGFEEVVEVLTEEIEADFELEHLVTVSPFGAPATVFAHGKQHRVEKDENGRWSYEDGVSVENPGAVEHYIESEIDKIETWNRRWFYSRGFFLLIPAFLLQVTSYYIRLLS